MILRKVNQDIIFVFKLGNLLLYIIFFKNMYTEKRITKLRNNIFFF